MNDHRQLVSSGGPYELIVGYSRAVRVGDRIFVAGTAPQWPDGQVDPSPTVQARRCFEIIEAALREAGATLARRRAHAHLPHRGERLRRDRRGARRAVRRDAPCEHDARREGAARPRVEGGDRGRGDRRACESERWPTSGLRGGSGRDHGRRTARGRPEGGSRSPMGSSAVSVGRATTSRGPTSCSTRRAASSRPG